MWEEGRSAREWERRGRSDEGGREGEEERQERRLAVGEEEREREEAPLS
jgi:hypothetical protein